MTQEFLAAIGAIVIESGVLEQQIHAATWSVLVGPRFEDQELGRIITSDLSVRKTFELFSSVVRHRFPDQPDVNLSSLATKVTQAEEKRNLIVHSTWALAEDSHYMRVKMTRKGNLAFCDLTVADVLGIAAEIHSAAESVLNFHLSLLHSQMPTVTL